MMGLSLVVYRSWQSTQILCLTIYNIARRSRVVLLLMPRRMHPVSWLLAAWRGPAVVHDSARGQLRVHDLDHDLNLE